MVTRVAASGLQRNTTWMAERTIAQMDHAERLAYEDARSADGWSATLKQRLQRWPSDFMGIRPTVAGVIAEMQRISFAPEEACNAK